MKSSSRFTVLASLGVITAVGFVSFMVWQYTPEVDHRPSNAPVLSINMTTGESVPLTQLIKNPAGITHLPDSDTYLISTDDRVVAEVTSDFSTVLSSTKVPDKPLHTGDTEGVAYLGDGTAAVLGENGVVVILKRVDGVWTEQDRYPVAAFKSGTQLGSAAYDPETRTLYSAQKKGGKVLYKIDIDSRHSESIPMSLDTKFEEKEDRSWEEFYVAGLEFHEGKLYGVSESFSAVLTITPEGIVENITGVNDINESSGITLRDGVLTLVGDAESYLPAPPIYLISDSALLL